MISLGNFYFGALNSKDQKYEAHLKDSYKFFYAALSEDTKNIYATNGLGMICAEKGILQVSKDIFQKAREECHGADIGINLAHVHIAQNRYTDAEHLYLSTIKPLLGSCSIDKVVSVYEWTALAQLSYNRMENALHSLLKGTHLNPLAFRLWFNVAIVNRDFTQFIKNKLNRNITDIEIAIDSIDSAQQIFSFFAKTSISFKREPQYERSIADKLSKTAKEMKYETRKLYDETMKQKRIIEEQKKKKEDEHNQWKTLKLSQEQEAKDKELQDLKQLKERSTLKQKQLSELNEKWISSSSNDNDDIVSDDDEMDVVDKKKSKKDNDDNDDDDDDDNEPEINESNEIQDGDAVVDELIIEQPNKKQKIAESDLFGSDSDEEE